VDDVEGSGVSLTVHDDTNSPQVTTSSHHADVSGFKFDEVCDLAGGNVNLHAVLGLDQRIRISDSAAIGGSEVRDTLGTDGDFLDNTELVSGLLFADAMHLVSSFDVVDEAEVFSAFLHFDDVHESRRVSVVGADSAIDFDETLGQDLLDLGVIQGVLETISQEERQREALAELVGTGRRSGGVATSQFVEHPVLGRRHALHVLTGTANHFEILCVNLWENFKQIETTQL